MDRTPHKHMEHRLKVLPWHEEVPIIPGDLLELLELTSDAHPLFSTAAKFSLGEHVADQERFLPHLVRLNRLSPSKLTEKLGSIGFVPAPLRYYLSLNRQIKDRNVDLKDRALCYVGQFVQPFEGNSWWQTFLFFQNRNEYHRQLVGIYEHDSYFLGPSKGEYDGDRYAIVMPVA